MVIKKTLPFMLILLVFVSCYIGKVSKFDKARKRMSKYESSKDIDIIDTLSLYKLSFTCIYNEDHNIYEKREPINKESNIFLKFYNKGKFALFVFKKSQYMIFQHSDFNPEKAEMGYFNINDYNIKTKLSIIGYGGRMIIKKNGFVKNDSIFLHNVNNLGYIYIKKSVPHKLFKDWQPDW